MDTYLIIDTLLRHDLTELMESLMEYVDSIDNTYQTKFNNNLIRHWQSKNVTLKSVILTDLLDWLSCLAFSDGFIAPEEVDFINDYLNQSFACEDIIDLCKFRINREYFNHLPLSFILLYENDLIMRDNNKWFDFNSIEHLYNIFMIIGVHFIHCDGKASSEEWNTLNEYLEDLNCRINDFDFIQEHLAVLESPGDVYLEDRYPFNQDIYNEYVKELSELKSLEEITEEFQKEDFFSETDFNPWVMDPNDDKSSYWQSNNIKTPFSWDLEKNINAYYDFTGEFENHLADIGEIITEKNREVFEIFYLTPQQYWSILNKIKSMSDRILYKTINENHVEFNSLSIFEKMVVFTNSFVETDYKSYGGQLGVYSLNKIHLDDRLDTASQIMTLIHELAHHLLAEIFEQAVMILLNTDKTDAVEMFVQMALGSSDSFVLFNEYCAHSVESHFTPLKYHNYGSFLNVLEKFDPNNDLDKQVVMHSMRIGNTFCNDILTIIEPFIESNLKDGISQEFNKNSNDSYNPNEISFKIEDTVDIDRLLEYINIVLLSAIKQFS